MYIVLPVVNTVNVASLLYSLYMLDFGRGTVPYLSYRILKISRENYAVGEQTIKTKQQYRRYC